MRKTKTDLDSKIELTKTFIQEWARLIKMYVKYRGSREIPSKSEEESIDILAWLQKNYSTIGREIKLVVSSQRYEPLTGVYIKDYDPVLNVIMSVGSLGELLSHRLKQEFEDNLRSGRNRLNAYLGFLERKKATIGEINVEEYQKLKNLFGQNVKEAERLSEREDLIKRLPLKLKHFAIAQDYFEEAKSCFRYGFFRASTIVAISALESCLKTDFRRMKEEEYEGKLINLLNRYFSGDLKRLPKQYEDFSKTYIKIRNSFTHPEEFDYSETIVFTVLSTVMELMRHIENLY
ncbi:MAG: hypothetical protein OEZ35_04590 [Candidatus Bathyarchaeota archaeon]|nr:hypothetical protein [Candidatus Bathyarchaeota archaeon]